MMRARTSSRSLVGAMSSLVATMVSSGFDLLLSQGRASATPPDTAKEKIPERASWQKPRMRLASVAFGLHQIGVDFGLAEPLCRLQPMQAFDQDVALAVVADLDRRLNAI